MPDIFEELKEKDLEFYQNIIYDIVDLPALDPDVIDRVYKVSGFICIFTALLINLLGGY